MKIVPTTAVTVFLFCFLFVCGLGAQIPANELFSPGNNHAELISAPDAKFPDISKEAFIWGKVNVRVAVNPNGTVKSATVGYGPGDICTTFSSPPVTALRVAATDAALASKFKPAKTELEQILTFDFPEPEGAKTSTRSVSVAAAPVGQGGGLGIISGRATFLPKPEYPAAARAVRASGTVDIRVLILEDGTVYRAKAVSGHPLLQRASEVAACSAKFSPFVEGPPAKMMGIVRYNFVP